MRFGIFVIFVLLLPLTLTGSLSLPTVVVVNETMYPGSTIRVEGWGFPGESAFSIYIDDASVANGTTYSDGSFYRALALSRRIDLGVHNLSASSGSHEARTQMTVVQWPTQIEVDPSSVRPGKDVVVCGQGYPPLAYWEGYLGSSRISGGATNGRGEFCFAYTLPKNVSLGPLNISVAATQYTGPPSARFLIQVEQWEPGIAVSPQEPSPGGFAVVNGTGFPPGALYKVYIDQIEILAGTTDLGGSFVRPFILPQMIDIGTHVVAARSIEYTGPPEGLCQISVVQWPLSVQVQPSLLHPGQDLTLLGTDLPPNAHYTISLDGIIIASGEATSEGTFQVGYHLKENTSLGPRCLVVVASGYTGPPAASYCLNITQWPVSISIEPRPVHPGSRIIVAGRDLPPLADYRILLDSVEAFGGTTNETGGFATEWVIPSTLSAGNHTLAAVVSGYTGPPSRTLTVEITPWPVEVQILPPTPHPGQVVQLIGSGYPPFSVCEILLDRVRICGGIVDEEGAFNVSCVLPRELELGTHIITVEGSFPGLKAVTLSVPISRWPTMIVLSPESGPPTTTITLNGSGFPPHSRVQIFWEGVYSKATQCSDRGEFSVGLVVQHPDSNSYRTLEALAPDYAGPPSVKAFFWVGRSPPGSAIDPCDMTGLVRYSYFSGEAICVVGGIFPPSLEMDCYLVREGERLSPESAAAHARILSSPAGIVAPSLVGEAEAPDMLRLWLDTNGNGIFDANDVLGTSPIQMLHRPDLSLTNVSLSSATAVQGEAVLIKATVKNEGQATESAHIAVMYGEERVTSGVVADLQPGDTGMATLSWDTSEYPAGTGILTVKIETLPGEIDTEDNEYAAGWVSLLPRPDIALLWLIPESRIVHKGKDLRIRVMARNAGLSAQAFRISLYWGQEELAHLSVNLGAQRSQAYVFDLSTQSMPIDTRILEARAEVLPYDRDPSDNSITNGTLSILAPNQPPRADAGGPYTGVVGQAVSFDASWSYDVDGPITSYRWDFGDGHWGHGVKASHTYLEEGYYTVRLTATDDLGDSSSDATTATIGKAPIECWLTISVMDAVKLTPLANPILTLNGSTHVLEEGSLSVRLAGGAWTISIWKQGYSTIDQTIFLDRDRSIAYELAPMLDVYPCDAMGRMKTDYSVSGQVYVCLDAPDRYAMCVYVVRDGQALDGRLLLDVTSNGCESVSESGALPLIVWPANLVEGRYDLVLDLNSNGIFDLGLDVLNSSEGAAFTIPDVTTMSAFLGLAMLVLRHGPMTMVCRTQRACRPEDPKPGI